MESQTSSKIYKPEVKFRLTSGLSFSLPLLIFSLFFTLPVCFAQIGTWMSLGLQGIGMTSNELNLLPLQQPSLQQIDPLTGAVNSLSSLHQTQSALNPYGGAGPLSSIAQQQLAAIRQQARQLSCAHLDGLSKGQTQICELNKDHIYFIGRAARIGISECQHQFQKSRWNCSTVNDNTVFGPIINTASKEVAFTHAISAAAVVHSLARACRDGALSNCGCSRAKRPATLRPQWKWAGCGDNINYAYRFGKPFVDVREEEQTFPRLSKRQGRKLMNLHNNEAGRLAVIKKTRVTCKCHGVSGSCSVVTCWQQLSTFREVGDHLKDRYEAATEVKLNKRGKLQVANKRFARPTKLDLVYVDDSPDYCSAEHLRPLAAKSTSTAAVSRKWRKSSNGRSVNSKRAGSATRSQRKRSSDGPLATYSASQSADANDPNTIDIDQKPPRDHEMHENSKNRFDSSASSASSSSSASAASVATNGLDSSSTLNQPPKEFVYEEGAHMEPETDAQPPIEQGERDPSTGESSDSDDTIDQHSSHHGHSDSGLFSNVNDNDGGSNRNPAWLGTQGRVCNRSSLSTDSCSLMCCGRGYNTQRIVVEEKCNCKFNWCCWVECDTCKYVKTIYTCK